MSTLKCQLSLLFSLELAAKEKGEKKKMDYEFMEEFVWIKNGNPRWMG